METSDINTYATVFSKAKKIVMVGNSFKSLPYVTFEFPDETRKAFECDISIYLTLEKGDYGYITYKELYDLRILTDFKRER